MAPDPEGVEPLSASPTLGFYLSYVLVLAMAFAFELMTTLEAVARLILFIPLLWSYAILNRRAMTVSWAVISSVRIGVEVLHYRSSPYDTAQLIAEVLFPVLLYAALGVAFHRYRVHQSKLMERVAELRASDARVMAANSLAHDFNNILTVILGMCDLTLLDNNVDVKTRQDLEQMKQAALRGASLVAEWMMIQPKGVNGRPGIDLSQELPRQVVIVERMLPQNIQVEYFFAKEALPVSISPNQLHRIIMNLCINARNAMTAGGRLTIRTGLVKDEKNREHAALGVTDTGEGMDPAITEQVFEPFFTTGGAEGGAGMGLSAVQMLVKAAGGWVSVESTPQKGSTFTVFLPIVELPTHDAGGKS